MLPQAPADLVGRDHDVHALRLRLVRPGPSVLSIVGPGGAGKTSLALRAAERLVDDFDDRRWFVDLTPAGERDDIVGRLAGIVGAPAGTGRSDLDDVRAALASGPALVVLDNCEHVLDAVAPVVVALAQVPGCVVLATSREPLRVPGEEVWPIPPLGAEDAVQLFRQRAGRSLAPDTESDAIRDLCERLDRLPLAIELAAARAGSMRVPEITDRLDRRFEVLAGRRGVADRHRTLRGSIEWSWDLLTDAERTMLSRLSVFVGSFPADGAVAVGGHEVDVLLSLVDRSLVDADASGEETRYRLLESIRAFAAEALARDEDPEEVRAQHFDWLRRYVAIAQPLVERGDLPWTRRLDAIADDIDAAVAWAVANGRLRQVSRMVVGLAFWAGTSRRCRQGAAWLDAVAAAADELEPPARGPLLVATAYLSTYVRRSSTAQSRLDEGLAIAESLGDDRLLGWALQIQGYLLLASGEHASSDESLERVVAYGEARVGESAFFWGISLLAMNRHFRGEYTSGRDLLDEHLPRARDIQSVRLWFLVMQRCDVAIALGDLADADGHFPELAAIAGTVQEDGSRAQLERVAAELAFTRGDLTQAASSMEQAWTVTGADPPTSLPALFAILDARIALAQDRPEDALAVAERYLDHPGTQPRQRPALLLERARSLVFLGRREDAACAVQDALEAAREHGQRPVEAEALGAQADLAFAGGDLPSALDLALRSVAGHARTGAQVRLAEAVERLAAIHVELGELDRAVRLLAATEAARTRIGAAPAPAHGEAVGRSLAASRDRLGEEGFASAWAEGRALSLDDAVAYATRGRGTRKRPDAGWHSLTPAELEVVKLLAEGLTNVQIAERLFVSRGTVKTHVSHVLSKLGMTTRAEVAAEAARRLD